MSNIIDPDSSQHRQPTLGFLSQVHKHTLHGECTLCQDSIGHRLLETAKSASVKSLSMPVKHAHVLD